MKVKIGDYFIESDERQYKVKTYIGVDKDGNDTYKTLAYCTSIHSALKFVPQSVLKSNDDISIILNKLEKIHTDIKEYKKIEEEIKEVYKKKLEVAIREFKSKQKSEGGVADE